MSDHDEIDGLNRDEDGEVWVNAQSGGEDGDDRDAETVQTPAPAASPPKKKLKLQKTGAPASKRTRDKYRAYEKEYKVY